VSALIGCYKNQSIPDDIKKSIARIFECRSMHGHTLLASAARHGYVSLVRSLVEDISELKLADIPGKENMSVLFWALVGRSQPENKDKIIQADKQIKSSQSLNDILALLHIPGNSSNDAKEKIIEFRENNKRILYLRNLILNKEALLVRVVGPSAAMYAQGGRPTPQQNHIDTSNLDAKLCIDAYIEKENAKLARTLSLTYLTTGSSKSPVHTPVP